MKQLIILLLFSASLYSQTPLTQAFDPLIGRTWITANADSSFRQEVTFSYDLDSTLVIAESDGYTDQSRTQWGARNHGIRRYNPNSKEIEFYEFDVFGGLTEGKVTIEGKNLYYSYQYADAGDMILTDGWEYISDGEYAFKVGNRENGQWQQIFIESIFKALPRYSGPKEDLFAILAATEEFSTAYMAEDAAEITAKYTTDAKIMPGGTLIIEGHPAIQERWTVNKTTTDILHHQVTPSEIIIEGDTAYDHGYYRGSSVHNGVKSEWRGKYVIIWKKVDGHWLIYLDIWNRVDAE